MNYNMYSGQKSQVQSDEQYHQFKNSNTNTAQQYRQQQEQQQRQQQSQLFQQRQDQKQQVQQQEQEKKLQQQKKFYLPSQPSIKIQQTQKTNDYDIQFLFNKLSDLGTGFVINNTLHESFNDQKAYLIGVLGNFNSGKSFILSQLIGNGTKLSQGIAQTTEGLNIKSQKDQVSKDLFHFIDTAGCGEPLQCFQSYRQSEKEFKLDTEKLEKILKETNSRKEQQFQEQIQSECFLQAYIVTECHLVLVVVDIMNREDEKFINGVQNKIQNQLYAGTSRLIIVHNFKQLTTIQDVQTKIEKDITNSFHTEYIQKEIDNGAYVEAYCDYSFSDITPVVHLAMAQEGSKAGEKYNSSAIKFIKQQFKTQMGKLKPINIYQSFSRYCEENIHQYLEKQDESNESTKMELSNGPQEGEYHFKELLEIYKKNGNQLKTNHMFFDYFGRPIFSNQNCMTPAFNIITSEKGICLIVDLPGFPEEGWEDLVDYNVTTQIEQNKNLLQISIRATRIIQYYDDIKPDNLTKSEGSPEGKIKYGSYSLDTILTKNHLKYNSKSIQKSYKQGQYIVSYKCKDDATGF